MIKKTLNTLFLVLITTMSNAQNVGIGTLTPNASAMLDITSTTQGFLPPRMTQTQMNAIVSPAEGLLVYCTDCNPKGMYAYNGASFNTLSENAVQGSATLTCGSAVNTGTLEFNQRAINVYTTISYTAGNGGILKNFFVASTGVTGLVATASYRVLNNGTGTVIFYISGTPSNTGTANFLVNLGGNNCTISHNVTIPTITSATTGRVWMDRNLGASRQATSSTDSQAYGDLYQWGRKKDGHQIRTSATSPGPVTEGTEGSNFITVASAPFNWLNTYSTTRWNTGNEVTPVKNLTHDPCPAGFRIPTGAEWEAELNGFSPVDNNGAFNALKLTLGGSRLNTGSFFQVGISGRYWSSLSLTNNDARLLLIYTTSTYTIMDTGSKIGGLSIRCIQE